MLPTTSYVEEKRKQGGEGTVRLATLRDESRLSTAKPWELHRNYWLATIFAIHGRPFPLMAMIVYVGYSILVVALVSQLLPNYRESVTLRGVEYPVQTIGLALFLLISLRTQTSYDRWWEGRKSWGTITTLIQDIARHAECYVDDSALASKLITWSTVFAVVLKHQLHYISDVDKMPGLRNLLPLGDRRLMKIKGATPMLALQQATTVLKQICIKEQQTSANEKPTLHLFAVVLILTDIDNRISRLGTESGVCMRIRNTPMPAGYVIHLRSFLVLWLLLLPFAFLTQLGWYSIAICFVVGYELLGYEDVGSKIENPFTESYHALPLDGLLATIITNSAFFMGCIDERSGKDPSVHGKPASTIAARQGKSAVASAHVFRSSLAQKSFLDMQDMASKRALYERLGGEAAVTAAVDLFYKKLLGDDRIAHFFNGISMERLKIKQIKFLTYALGGAENYMGRDPAISHRRLHNEKGLRVEHFHIVVGHLQDTLRELGVSEEHIAECTQVLAPMEKTFGCGDGQVCIGHVPESTESAHVTTPPASESSDPPLEGCPFEANAVSRLDLT